VRECVKVGFLRVEHAAFFGAGFVAVVVVEEEEEEE
jgi:hypothetical protein